MKTILSANDRRRRVRNDILTIAGLLAVVMIAGLCLYLLRGEGDTVTVAVDGEVHGVYPLSQDREEVIQTENGHRNALVIRGGRAYMADANCPDRICAEHRPIHRSGESIVCLPHRVVITVTRTASETEPDIVV